MVNDPIADALARIKNSHQRSYKTVNVLNTKLVASILQILKSENYIEDYSESSEDKNEITVVLKYENKTPSIKSLRRVSKPGLRKYIGYKDIPKILNGLGISILSTPKGIMTGKEARAQKTGGEFLCTIY